MARRTRPVWTYDTETDPFLENRDPQPFVWGIYDGAQDRYYEFWKLSLFIEFIESEFVQRQAPVVYAHNGGKFADYHCLRDQINSDEKIMVISGRLARFKIGAVEFRDSLNILPVALKVFSKEKVDYSIMEAGVRELPQNKPIISAYLESDCRNLHAAVTGFQKEYGKGLTQAGAAMTYWQKKFKVKAPRQTAVSFEQYKPFYYGGRVQCFEQGNKYDRFKVVDINSAYPRAMLENHPICTEATREERLPADSKISRCFVRLDAIAQGCFPLRGGDGSLYFPDDSETTREYFVTGWELQTALELNAVKIVRIKEVHHFTQTINFKDYIDHFYEKRLDAKRRGNKAEDVYAKLLMNSLYGKFSSDPSRYKEYIITDTEEWAARWRDQGYGTFEDFGRRLLVSRDIPEEKQRYYNIATAASITGWVRAYLFKAIRSCSGVLYCDTDSIAARDIGNLTLGGALGEWKLEMECDEYAIAGKKLYAFRDVKKDYTQEDAESKGLELGPTGWYKTACKGVDFNPQQIIDVANGREVIHVPKVPTYSIHKNAPKFTERRVNNTFKDIRIVA